MAQALQRLRRIPPRMPAWPRGFVHLLQDDDEAEEVPAVSVPEPAPRSGPSAVAVERVMRVYGVSHERAVRLLSRSGPRGGSR